MIGVLGHHAFTVAVVAIFAGAWLSARALSVGQWRRLACGVIGVELFVQCLFHAKYTVPSFYRASQWEAVAREVERMPPAGGVFAGDIVQDLSLRARIAVLPTYYVLKKPADSAVRDFFTRQNCVPAYFVLLESNVNEWSLAPAFMNSLQEVWRCRLIIGGLGWQDVHFYRFNSYDWLVDPGKP